MFTLVLLDVKLLYLILSGCSWIYGKQLVKASPFSGCHGLAGAGYCHAPATRAAQPLRAIQFVPVTPSPCSATPQHTAARGAEVCEVFWAPQTFQCSRLGSTRATSPCCSSHGCPCAVSPCAWAHVTATCSEALAQLLHRKSLHTCWEAPERLLLQQLGVQSGSYAVFPASPFPVLLLPTAPTYQRQLQRECGCFLTVSKYVFCLLWNPTVVVGLKIYVESTDRSVGWAPAMSSGGTAPYGHSNLAIWGGLSQHLKTTAQKQGFVWKCDLPDEPSSVTHLYLLLLSMPEVPRSLEVNSCLSWNLWGCCQWAHHLLWRRTLSCCSYHNAHITDPISPPSISQRMFAAPSAWWLLEQDIIQWGWQAETLHHFTLFDIGARGWPSSIIESTWHTPK